MENKYVVILSVCLVIISLLIGAVVLTGSSPTEEEIDEYLKIQVSNAVNQVTLAYQDEIVRLNGLLVTVEETPVDAENVEAEIEFTGYSFEDTFLITPLNKWLSDRDTKLYDTEVEFNDKDYDVEETFYVNGSLSINGDDYEENVYLTFEKGDLIYAIVLEDTLNLSAITFEEKLTLSVLGETYEISEWDGKNIVLSKGTENLLEEEESITINEKVITLDFVLKEKVYVTVDGESLKLDEIGDMGKVNGIEIKLVDIMYTEREDKTSKAVLQIGNEVEVELLAM